MTDEHRMELLSRAYVQAVAAVCGCTSARPDPDYGSDLTLRRVESVGGMFRPVGRGLDMQLKSTTTATLTPNEVVHDLDARAYDLLRHSTLAAPLLLLLFVMPADPALWLTHREEVLELRGGAYWLSLRRAPAVPNRSTVRVRIPRANQFTPAALSRIMTAVANAEEP